MKTGIATIPLEWGRCPRWLFERMKRLSRGILLAIVQEFGPEEILKRLADPVWFQSFGCVMGFDWNSSGLTTTTLGAIKTGIFDIQHELGIFICGGKGKTSRKTPQEIEKYGQFKGSSFVSDLVYASRMAAKVDSALVQDGYQIYHHNFLFTKTGRWTVIQQGLNPANRTARRYHWLSSSVKSFVEEPHSGIITDVRTKPLNLTAKISSKNREISTQLVAEEPKTFLKDFKVLLGKGIRERRLPAGQFRKKNFLMRQKRTPSFVKMELNNVEFHWHPILKERFDLKRLTKTIFLAHYQKPKNFEKLLAIKGIGPKTIRALSLVSEIVYGAKPSYEDPARYSFAVGGKDGTPFFVKKDVYDKLLAVMEKGIRKTKISQKEKDLAIKRLTFLNSKI